MNKEQVLLNELNALGNFDTVQQEFNELQLEAIYNSMDAVEKSSDIQPVIGLSILEKLEEAEKHTLQHDINEFNREWKSFWKPVNDWLLKILNAL